MARPNLDAICWKLMSSMAQNPCERLHAESSWQMGHRGLSQDRARVVVCATGAGISDSRPFDKLRAGSSQKTRRNGAPTVLVMPAGSKACATRHQGIKTVIGLSTGQAAVFFSHF